jgi:rhodanese-related sulfurtransferase
LLEFGIYLAPVSCLDQGFQVHSISEYSRAVKPKPGCAVGVRNKGGYDDRTTRGGRALSKIGAPVLFIAVLFGAGIVRGHTDLTPAEARSLIDTSSALTVLDVRELAEFCDSTYSPPGHIPGAVNMPWNSMYLQSNYHELPMDQDILVVCRSGNRSNSAANFLESVGFTRVYDMLYGMNGWLWETEGCGTAGVTPLPTFATWGHIKALYRNR